MTAIPKVIHYIWVGPQPISKLTKQCIDSWKKNLPEYELKLWNEKNFPDTEHPYYQKMYQEKKWAFVSDYMRFWILKKYGGVYLDTDQEVLKDFTELLDNESVWGRTKDGQMACGFIATQTQNPLIQDILTIYSHLETSPKTSPLASRQAYNALSPQEKERVTILDSKFIYPVDAGEPVTKTMLEQAYTTHHWAESWVPYAKTRKVIRFLAAKFGLYNVAKLVWQKIKSKK